MSRRRHRPRRGKQPKVAAVTSFATRFGVAGIHEEPMGPGLEPIGIPEARQMTPRVEQCLLRGVLGEVRVTQDPACHRVQRVTDASDQLVERLFVAAHRQLDELTHSLTHYGAGRDRGQSVSMSGLARRAFNRRARRPRRYDARPVRVGAVPCRYGAWIWIERSMTADRPASGLSRRGSAARPRSPIASRQRRGSTLRVRSPGRATARARPGCVVSHRIGASAKPAVRSVAGHLEKRPLSSPTSVCWTVSPR